MAETKQGWQALVGGATLEIVTGQRSDGKGGTVPATRAIITSPNQLITEPLSDQLVKRWEDGEPHLRSQVQKVEYDVLTRAVVGIVGGESATESTATSAAAADEQVKALVEQLEEAQGRAADAEQELANGREAARQALQEAQQASSALEQRATEAETRLDETEQRAAAAEAEAEKAKQEAAGALTFGDISKEALIVEAEQKGVTVTRGDGKPGDPLKDDYELALEEARQARQGS